MAELEQGCSKVTNLRPREEWWLSLGYTAGQWRRLRPQNQAFQLPALGSSHCCIIGDNPTPCNVHQLSTNPVLGRR